MNLIEREDMPIETLLMTDGLKVIKQMRVFNPKHHILTLRSQRGWIYLLCLFLFVY